MFLGINMSLALLRAHFNPRYARAKIILSRAKNIFMPANVNSIVILENNAKIYFNKYLVVLIEKWVLPVFSVFLIGSSGDIMLLL